MCSNLKKRSAFLLSKFKQNKENIVNIFEIISKKYRLFNNLSTFGLINYWRDQLVKTVNPDQNDLILDLCTGQGSVSCLLAEKHPEVKIIGVDFCEDMLKKARENINNKKIKDNIQFKSGNALSLNFPDNYFDHVTISFGLRNIKNMSLAIKEMKRVVKPGGKIICMDLARVKIPVFHRLHKIYFNYYLPILGKIIYGQKEPFAYLINSYKNFPSQKELKNIFTAQGLKNVNYRELNGGIIAIHQGTKKFQY